MTLSYGLVALSFRQSCTLGYESCREKLIFAENIKLCVLRPPSTVGFQIKERWVTLFVVLCMRCFNPGLMSGPNTSNMLSWSKLRWLETGMRRLRSPKSCCFVCVKILKSSQTRSACPLCVSDNKKVLLTRKRRGLGWLGATKFAGSADLQCRRSCRSGSGLC